MLHSETVEAGTLALLRKLINDRELETFNLAGGTALALQLGHRKSIDIDLFTDRDFDAERLANHLINNYNLGPKTGITKNGVFCKIDNIKVDILAHQYPLINKVVAIEGIRMLSLEDIGAMKLNVILYNGTRLKDFADMYKLLEHISLEKITNAFVQKYPGVNPRMAHNGLLYYTDVNKTEIIEYTGKEILFGKIADRLKQSVAEPSKIFKSEEVIKQKQIQSKKLIEKKSLRKRPGLNL